MTKEITYEPLPYKQVTDPLTGMWIREYIYPDSHQNAVIRDYSLKAQLNVRKDQLNVPTWREYYAWRLQ